jgi:flagellar biosynthesis chaperone FliJ
VTAEEIRTVGSYDHGTNVTQVDFKLLHFQMLREIAAQLAEMNAREQRAIDEFAEVLAARRAPKVDS